MIFTSVKLPQDFIERTLVVNLMPFSLLDLDKNWRTDRRHRDVYEYCFSNFNFRIFLTFFEHYKKSIFSLFLKKIEISTI